MFLTYDETFETVSTPVYRLPRCLVAPISMNVGLTVNSLRPTIALNFTVLSTATYWIAFVAIWSLMHYK